MRSIATIIASIVLAAACQSQQTAGNDTTIEASSTSPSVSWRDIAPENLVIVSTAYGEILIELNPSFAPKHAEQFRRLVRERVYDGARFYRVIDAFVAQGGLQDEAAISLHPNLANENDRPISDADFVPLGNADLFAPVVGHMEGFAVGQSEELGKEWLLHCPGAFAMARDVDPDSGGTEFYIVLDAQRYLDRNLTIFGRVIHGMQYVQKLKRGDRAVQNGVIQHPEEGDVIHSMTIAADLDIVARPKFQVQAMPSAEFEAAKAEKRVREEDFFYRKPPEILDICGFEVPVRRTPDDDD